MDVSTLFTKIILWQKNKYWYYIDGKSDSNSNWFPWAKKEFENKWYKVICPNLTNTDYPVIEEQLKDLENIKLNPWDVIIWHSLGGKLWLKFIEDNKIKRINVLFAAPVYDNLADELWEKIFWDAFYCLASYFNTVINFRNVNKLWNKFAIFLSDNDPFINMFSAKEYFSRLENIDFIEFHNMGHLSQGTDNFTFPELFEYVR